MKQIAILGSTGSIGTQTLEVVQAHPDLFRVVALSAGRNISLLKQQIEQFSPRIVSLQTKELAERLKNEIKTNTTILYGEEGMIEVATFPDADFVVTAIVGSIGLKPTIKVIEAGKPIGLANKETLVTAGHIVMEMAKKHQVPIIPIDSEHSAVFQSLQGSKTEEIRRIILTASGGAFRNKTRNDLRFVTVEDALKHPNWSMGAKITVDSATMINKGLEVIEAHWLFSMPFEKIDVMIHPESIIHSMVEYQDLAIIAQMGTPDMKVPIQYALSYPNRVELKGEPLDFAKIGLLHFSNPDDQRFPGLKLAYRCGIEGGTMTTVMNAANEVIVEAFLKGRVPFIEIENSIQAVLDQHIKIGDPSLEEILEADQWARKTTLQIMKNKGW